MGVRLENSNLTEKQKKFCREYLKNYNFNASAAYVAAGYKKAGANANASRLLNNPEIQNYLNQLMAVQENKDIADIGEITQFLTEVLRGNVKDTVVTAQGLREAKTMVKDRIKSAELLGKRHGMFLEVHEITDRRSKIDELIEQIDDLKAKK